MKSNLSSGGVVGLALALLVASAGPALAQRANLHSYNESPFSSARSPIAHFNARPAAVTYHFFEVDFTDSNDAFGEPINERFQIDVGANAMVTGIGWDVLLYADSPSWLSEMALFLSGDLFLESVVLRPGSGVNSSGYGSYSSNGIVDLIGLGLDFAVGASGILNLEFYETFDDYADDWDGFWESGLITIEVTTPSQVVPEPASVGLIAFGLVALAATRRRISA